MYVCLVCGEEVARFYSYEKAVEYMRRWYGVNWEMYDYGIVEDWAVEID